MDDVPLRYRHVSFLSDLGTRDELAGVCRAVIADLAPDVRITDLTHEVAQHDVRAGGLALARAVPYVPAGVILAVVDPGVGSARRAVAVEVADGAGVFVGPDNGLLAHAVAVAGGAGRAVELTDARYHLAAPSPTFAARDVFAPAAAHLCLGVDLLALGIEVDPHTMLPGTVPIPRMQGEELVVEVLWVDHYGNVQLNVDPEEIADWGASISLRWDDVTRTAARVSSFAEIGSRVGLVVDGSGLLAVCLERRSAAEELGLVAGTELRLARLTDGPGTASGVGDPDSDQAAGVTTPVHLTVRR